MSNVLLLANVHCCRHLAWIRAVQVELNEMGAVTKALPHLARPCDRIAREVLGFVSIMLFNANEPVQVSGGCWEFKDRV